MKIDELLHNYYDGYDEDGRLLTRCGSVEFLTTLRYIKKYLRPNDRIAEIGAASGRYSHTLAREDYKVDAVELLKKHIEAFKRNTESRENVSIRQGNALDLSFFPDETFDITLLLGPMYHLFEIDAQKKALSESLRITKVDGIIMAAYGIADASILRYCFKEGHIHEAIKSGLLNDETYDVARDPRELFCILRKRDIDDLMRSFPVERLHYVATDGYAWHMTDTINAMDDATFEEFLKYHWHTCENPDLTGITNHALDIFRKRG